MERTLVIVKPDGLQRGLLGTVIGRFEQKGLKIVGVKMAKLEAPLLKEHYSHISDKPFFPEVSTFMSDSPVVLLCIEGVDAVATVRRMCGITKAREADPGTIRGDYAMSVQANVVHASEDSNAAEAEVARFFAEHEVFDYNLVHARYVYASHER